MYQSQPSTNWISLAIGLLLFSVVGVVVGELGFQSNIIAAIIGIGVLLFLWRKPEYGILLFLSTFLFTYPSFLRGYGFFTINNALGAIFCLLLLVQLLREKDLWFLKCHQIQLMLGIGVIFLISTWFARTPPAFMADLDRTERELWDYFTQFAFVLFMINFIRTRFHIYLVFSLFIFVIILTAYSGFVGSADVDYRAMASFGINAASNSNRLGFFCLVGFVMVWYFRQEVLSPVRKMLLLALNGLLIFVVFLTASRSALINTLFLACILAVESGIQPRKILATMIIAGSLGFLIIKAVPEQNLERITSIESGSKHSEAASSAEGRLAVLQMGFQVFIDSNPLLGVGPGNFRWIRQLDYDLRRLSTHNGYLWALLAGGVTCLVLYMCLFWTIWRDLRWMELQPRSPDLPPMWMVKSLRTTLLLFLVFSLFAEIWLEIMPFFLVGSTIVLKRLYVKNIPAFRTV